MDDRKQELMDALDRDFPESWVPEKAGDKIVGTYVRTDEGPSDWGPVPIYVLDVDGKEMGVWAFHAVLRSQFEAARPKKGDMVGVVYKGEKEGAAGRTYKNYRVVNLDRTEAAPTASYAPPEDESAVPAAALAPSAGEDAATADVGGEPDMGGWD